MHFLSLVLGSEEDSLKEWRSRKTTYTVKEACEIVRHMQTLSLLQPPDDLVVEMEKNLSKYLLSTLQIAEKLKEVDTTGVKPMHNPSEAFSAYLRQDDEMVDRDRTREELQRNCSNTKDGFFVAPPTTAGKASKQSNLATD